MQAFVPKNRKPKFELTLRIIDLNNVPLVSGTSCVKWHLPSSTSAEHRGRTNKAGIKDHKAIWDYERVVPVRLTIDRNGTLQDTDIHFEISQEYANQGKGIQLGYVRLNLAEYVNKDDDEDSVGITRRYLMQQSKINSTLKIGIAMKQLEGDKNFTAPTLRTAMVFGGIAGIMASDPGDVDDTGQVPSITNKTRETSELQDMYRRTLAASWACAGSELPPDKLVENIFNGGDGGLMAPPPRPSPRQTDYDSDNESRRTVTNLHPDTARDRNRHTGGHRRNGSNNSSVDNLSSSGFSSVSGRGSIEQQINQSSRERKYNLQQRKELTEFDVRDDLRSWSVETRG